MGYAHASVAVNLKWNQTVVAVKLGHLSLIPGPDHPIPIELNQLKRWLNVLISWETVFCARQTQHADAVQIVIPV